MYGGGWLFQLVWHFCGLLKYVTESMFCMRLKEILIYLLPLAAEVLQKKQVSLLQIFFSFRHTFEKSSKCSKNWQNNLFLVRFLLVSALPRDPPGSRFFQQRIRFTSIPYSFYRLFRGLCSAQQVVSGHLFAFLLNSCADDKVSIVVLASESNPRQGLFAECFPYHARSLFSLMVSTDQKQVSRLEPAHYAQCFVHSMNSLTLLEFSHKMVQIGTI